MGEETMREWVADNKVKEATEYTIEKNRQVYESELKVPDELERSEEEELKRHCMLDLTDEVELKNAEGKVIRNRAGYEYMKKKQAPETVNPLLWKSCIKAYHSEILEVVKGKVYTACGLACSNVTFIRGNSGWIVQDTGISEEAMNFILDHLEELLYEKIRGNIKAILISHSHVDHISGIGALVTTEETGAIEEGKIPVIVPGPWEKSRVAEHAGAGNAMVRRSAFQFAYEVEKGVKGTLGDSLSWDYIVGKGSYIAPTMEIFEKTVLEIDGISIELIPTPDTETKAHMCTYIQNYRVLYLGDNGHDSIHYIINPRGIQVRDANQWGNIFYDLAIHYGNIADVAFSGHGRPHWNTKENPSLVKNMLLEHAAAYKYLHNQALHYANTGVTINELNHVFEIPDSIAKKWYLRPHYGDYTFDARGVLQTYLGFYDGNPIHLNPLPQSEYAKNLVAYIGSEERVLELAKRDFENGKYQWVAEITNAVVFANPQNLTARYLCADALEQLGYQSENATFRNCYLTAAYELRNPKDDLYKPMSEDGFSPKTVMQDVSTEIALDHFGIALDGSHAGDEDLCFLLQIVDEEHHIVENHSVRYFHGALLHQKIEDVQKLEMFRKQEEKHKDFFVVTAKKGQVGYLECGEKAIQEHFRTNRMDLLLHLCSYVTDFSRYAEFHIIED